MRYNSKDFRRDNYFVLYDKNDYPICFFADYNELSKSISYRCSDLVYKFNKFGNPIKLVIGNEFYKLFTDTVYRD